MRYGVDVCTLAEFADPGLVVELAVAAEAAGYEAVFVSGGQDACHSTRSTTGR